MAQTPKFPPAMQAWVTENFQKMQKLSPTIREAATSEMKSIIANAYSTNTMLTIPWSTIKLQSLATDSDPVKSLKRKQQEPLIGHNKKVQLLNKTSSPTPKPLTTNIFEDDARARREKRFEREAQIEQSKQNTTAGWGNHYSSGTNFVLPLAARIQGGKHFNRSWAAEPAPVADPNVIDWDRYTIVGRSQALFKNYLRLTSEPDPKDIRPLPILRQTLEKLKQKWRSEGNYHWVCDQFKSLRQDLTVQRIKNEFTVQVYEIHSRIALENSDLVEYNSMQGKLRELYELGLQGKNEEFLAYRILYLLHGRNRADLNLVVSQLTPQEKALPAVRHAIDVHMAMATGNYHKFFALYLVAPNMGGYIMDHYVDRERCTAMIAITKGYRSVSLALLKNELGYESNELPKLMEFLTAHSANVFTNPNAPDHDKHVASASVHAALIQAQNQKYAKVGIKGSV